MSKQGVFIIVSGEYICSAAFLSKFNVGSDESTNRYHLFGSVCKYLHHCVMYCWSVLQTIILAPREHVNTGTSVYDKVHWRVVDENGDLGDPGIFTVNTDSPLNIGDSFMRVGMKGVPTLLPLDRTCCVCC